MRAWSGLAVLLAALAMSTACSGDNKDATASVSPTASTTAASATVSAASPADAFAAVLAGFSTAQFRISYTFTTRSADQEFVGALTWVRAADGRERFETSSQQGDEAFELVVITDAAGEQVTCFAVSGFDSCFAGDDGPFGEIPNPTEIVFQNVLDPLRIDGVRATATRTILGRDAVCTEVDTDEGTSEACIAEGNLLLMASWTAPNGDGGSLEATELSTEVSDADFAPTGPISD